jgi:hypothetical protein
MGWTLGVFEAFEDEESAGVELRRWEGPHLLAGGTSRSTRSSRPEARVVLAQHERRPAGRASPGRGEGRTPYAPATGG